MTPPATPPIQTPESAPLDWRVLAWALAPPLVVLVLRAVVPGAAEDDTLQPVHDATLVSSPAQAFWMASRPLVYSVLALVGVVGAFVLALRRWGWARLRPALLATWVLLWATLGAWVIASEMNRAGRQPIAEQSAKVLLARQILPGKRTGAGGTEVYFELPGEPTPRRLFVEGQPQQAFVPGSTARLHAEAGRWWGQWGRLTSRLVPSAVPAPVPAASAPGG